MESVPPLKTLSGKSSLTAQSALTEKKPSSLSREAKKVLESAQSQSLQFAETLHKTKYIYALYGALDGLSLSYSMIKYCFDVLYSQSRSSSSDLLHDWMVTPAGAAVAAAEAVSLIGFSLFASVFDEKDSNAFKHYIAVCWPYVRNSMKSLKNAYKGVRSALQIATTLAGSNFNFLAAPVGILLGGISVLNRLWYQQMISTRKNMMRENGELLKNIKAAQYLGPFFRPKKNVTKRCIQIGDKLYYVNNKNCIVSETDIFEDHLLAPSLVSSLTSQGDSVHEVLARQRSFYAYNRRKALLSQAYSGFVDGLYLYMGVMGLSALVPPAFIALSVMCVIFTVACIAMRMYEEYEFQEKLLKSQAKIELALSGKQLEALFSACLKTVIASSDNQYTEEEQRALFIALDHKIDEFNNQRKQLSKRFALSYKTAALTGIKHGLAAYSAVLSILFAVAIICTICSVSFPPALVIVAVSSGLACLIGFTAFALYKNYNHVQKQKESIKNLSGELKGLPKRLKEEKKKVVGAISELKPADLLQDKMKLHDPSPQFFFQELFEVIRSAWSGLIKGTKATEFALNHFQEMDDHGHYQDTPIMLGVAVFSCAVHVVVLALRAFARGFGKPDLDASEETDENETKNKQTSTKQQAKNKPASKSEHQKPRRAQPNPSSFSYKNNRQALFPAASKNLSDKSSQKEQFPQRTVSL